MNGASDADLPLCTKGEVARHEAPASPSRWAVMMRRWRSRHALLQLDAEQLRDIGLTREQAVKEGLRPFWRP